MRSRGAQVVGKELEEVQGQVWQASCPLFKSLDSTAGKEVPQKFCKGTHTIRFFF